MWNPWKRARQYQQLADLRLQATALQQQAIALLSSIIDAKDRQLASLTPTRPTIGDQMTDDLKPVNRWIN